MIINQKSITMKKIFLLLSCISFSVFGQEGEMRINMWYGTVYNGDVEEHLALEKHYKSIWNQQKEAGNLTGWEMCD